MKKKLIVFLVAFILMQSGCKEKKPIITGYCLSIENGSYMIIATEGYPSGFPVTMDNKSENKALFENLRTGDKIKVTYDGIIQESYPGQMAVYSCEIIEKGIIENISQDIFDQLTEMGWIIK